MQMRWSQQSKCCQNSDKTQAVTHTDPCHGLSLKNSGKHDFKNKFQNHSCNKWYGLILKYEWHVTLYCFLNFPNIVCPCQVWAIILLRQRALYLFKSPDFNVLDKEIFLLRKCMIPKCFTRMASSMVEITIKPKGKFSSSTSKS